LPPSPLDALAGDAGLPNLATIAPGESSDRLSAGDLPPARSTAPGLVEAQGWRRSADGKVILVAAGGLPSSQVASCPLP
jgi:hypothetical protein